MGSIISALLKAVLSVVKKYWKTIARKVKTAVNAFADRVKAAI